MNEVMNVTEKTPIEIALRVNEDGYTTSSALHEFLEGSPKNYAKFCRENIVNNDFAIEGEDWFEIKNPSEAAENGVFLPKYENLGGRPKKDYMISASLAKRISMRTKTPKGEEARKYFLACEKGLVVATKMVREEIEFFRNKITELENTVSSLSDKSDLCLEQAELLKKHTKYLHDRVPVWEGGRGLRPSKEAERAKQLVDSTRELVDILNDRSQIANEYNLKNMIGEILKETDRHCDYKLKDVKKEYKDAYGTDNDYVLDMVAFSEDYYESYMATVQRKLLHIKEDDEYATREGNRMERVEQMFEEARERKEQQKQKEEEMRLSLKRQDEAYEEAYQKEKDRPGFGETYYDRVLISAHNSYVEEQQRLLENGGKDKPFDKQELFRELGLI